jgi:molybdopterin converting factor small subunit
MVRGKPVIMGVEVNIPTFLQHLTNDVKVVDVNGRTVGECFNDLVKQYPQLKTRLYERGKLLKRLNVYVNGESAYPEALARPVSDGDKIQIVYVVIGG